MKPPEEGHTVYFVGKVEDTGFRPIPGGDGRQQGYSRFPLVDVTVGSVHMGSGVCQLAPRGRLDLHAHGFEEGFFLLQGQVVLTIGGEAHQLHPGDYGFIPVGADHRWQNDGSQPARWLEALAPPPRPAAGLDTLFFEGERAPASATAATGDAASAAASDPALIELRDPQRPYLGHLEGSKPPASLVGGALPPPKHCEGLSVWPLLDQRTGTHLFWLIRPELLPGGRLDGHDHPVEEMYLFLEGEAEMELDGDRHLMRSGDFAWSSVGCVHSFANHGSVPSRWLEIIAPQPPSGQFTRFPEDWADLQRVLSQQRLSRPGQG